MRKRLAVRGVTSPISEREVQVAGDEGTGASYPKVTNIRIMPDLSCVAKV